MNAYTNIIVNLVEKHFADAETFGLIKLDNFPIPEIYKIVCERLAKKAKDRGIELIAKLSKEKYEFWVNNPENRESIAFLESEGYIEKTENLTKWRNHVFNTKVKNKTLTILMGTELVIDKGGLEDFHTVNPESVESFVSDNYAMFFNFENNDNETLNNLYKNIFKYVEKDLLKLSQFAEKYNDITKQSEMISVILGTCYQTWGIPNLTTLLETKSYAKLGIGPIQEIRKAYNFNRRIGLDNLPSKRRLDAIEVKIITYYGFYKIDIDSQFNELFPGYTDIEELKTDLINYYCGINIDAIRERLSYCDFITIDKMLGLKTKVGPPPAAKDIRIYGDPLNVFILSPIKMFAALDQDEQSFLSDVDIQIEQVKIANVSREENGELSAVWNRMCRFLGGIELAFNELNLVNEDDQPILCKLYAMDNFDQKVYPFRRDSIKKLIESQTLVAASARDTVSKITFSITFIGKDGEPLKAERFEWSVFDTDSWIQTFDIIDSSGLSDQGRLESVSSYLPIGICKNIGKFLDAINDDEFLEMYNTTTFSFNDLLVSKESLSQIDVKAYSLGKAFITILREINEKGFFNIIKNPTGKKAFINYLDSFNNLSLEMANGIADTTLQEKIYEIAKAFTIIGNEDELKAKGSSCIIIPPHHPVMLEKIIERYSFLTNGIAEILANILDETNISNSQIDRQYSKLDQLSTITFAMGAMLGANNKFESSKKTFGYTSIIGKSFSSEELINFSSDYARENEVLENLDGKLIPTPVSNYIAKAIMNYFKIYPFKMSGIKIMFFNPQNYSDIIIAIKTTLDLLKKNESIRINMDLIIYTDDFRCRAYNYLKYWIDNNITEDDTIRLRAQIKYVNLEKDNFKKNIEESIVEGDIAFLGDIMEEIDILPEVVREEKHSKSSACRYPSTFLPIPKVDIARRFTAISQLQFECEASYTRLLAKINNPSIVDGMYRLVRECKLKKEFTEIIADLHKKATWVVILDETVDPKLIRHDENEIIGFSTGEGYFGELNATISSDSSILKDIKKFLGKRLKSRFSAWTNEDIEKASSNCVKHAVNLDGAEVLKAINPKDEAVNNYLAFYLTSIIEQQRAAGESFYYRKLLSLDSYDHLFDTNKGESGYLQKKPDFTICPC